MPTVLGKRKREAKHPYLSGNFAPQKETLGLTICKYSGTIPPEFLGGQYVRNGSNPISNEDLGREAHWFDGDGMLSGVYFMPAHGDDQHSQPLYVNQYLLTDVYLNALSTPSLRRPILPSIATLINPLASIFYVSLAIIRAIILALLSRLPGSKQTIKKISVANTSILYHDGRALATCESGPPLRVSLPDLKTIGWFNGRTAEGELDHNNDGDVLGGKGPLSWMREWMTAHPKVDKDTNEMIAYHSNFAPPYVNYTILPADKHATKEGSASPQRLLNVPVPGVSSAKMMHDFGVSKRHTVIMDLPLSLDPLNMTKGVPSVSYDTSKPSRFGVFPRRQPDSVRWFETSACCIFHTANTWDELDNNGQVQSVHLLACRLTSANVVFAAGNLAEPRPTVKSLRTTALKTKEEAEAGDATFYEDSPLLESYYQEHDSKAMYADEEKNQCRLYYFSFNLQSSTGANSISDQFALSRIPFEFPSVHPDKSMSEARYIYGCTTTGLAFHSGLGRSSKIDALVKFDALDLIGRGKEGMFGPKSRPVDNRSVKQIIKQQEHGGKSFGDSDAVQIFHLPERTYAQEPRFVPRKDGQSEDDGYLVFYTFDENQLDPEGEPRSDATSELWIIDARGMREIVARIHLPQRVPYGLHGEWFTQEQIGEQREFERVRRAEGAGGKQDGIVSRVGAGLINGVVRTMGG